ncbi:MAG: PD40 domain-containing protein, partial [Chloroflexota bacterium]|nr:PD40 domain-containing protein [Chloroflexota bacterium]
MTRHWWMTGMVVLLLNIGCSGIGVTPKATPMAATAVQVGTAQLRGLEKIAFVRNQIYVMDADGRNVRWLTNDSAYHWSPAWSPDGRLIAFDTNRGDDEGIFVMDADGGNVHRLSNNPARDASPAWSSDGHWIAFQSFRDGNWQIYVMGSDGENVRRLTNNR